MVVTLLHNWEGGLGVDRLNIWANEFGLSHPVLDDQDYPISSLLWPDDIGRPNSVLLGPGAVIITYWPTEAQVAEQL